MKSKLVIYFTFFIFNNDYFELTMKWRYVFTIIFVSFFEKKKTRNDNNIVTIIQKKFQKIFQNVQRFHIDVDDDELTKKNMKTIIIINNNQQRIRNLQNEIIQFRNEKKFRNWKFEQNDFAMKLMRRHSLNRFLLSQKTSTRREKNLCSMTIRRRNQLRFLNR